MADLRIAVCVPGSNWKAGFGQAVSNMCINFQRAHYQGGDKRIEVFCVSGSLLPDVRMRCVAEAAKWDATHMLFLDDDMTFPFDALQCLLRHNVPVVGANYSRRQLPLTTTAYKADKSGPLYTRPGDTGLVEVSHLGTGIMLIDMRVFELLELPFFAFEHFNDGKQLRGEDVYFCHKLIEAGVKIYVDQDLSQHVGHIGEWTYTHSQCLLAEEHGKLLTDPSPDGDEV